MISMSVRWRGHLLVAAVLGLASACSGGGEFEFPVETEVLAGGAGVEGALLHMNGAEIGRTGANGRFSSTHKGVSGEEAVLKVTPPDDYKLGPDGGEFKVTMGTRETDDGEAPQTLAFRVELIPTTLEYVILITAPGKYRPVYVDDKQVGRTASTGAASIHLRRKPGDAVAVRVDTRSRKRSPLEKSFTLAEGDRVVHVTKEDVKTETDDEKEVRVAKAEAVEKTGGGGGRGGGGSAADWPSDVGADDGGADDGGGGGRGRKAKKAIADWPAEEEEADRPAPISDLGGANAALAEALDAPAEEPVPEARPSKDDKKAAKLAAKEAKASAKAAKAAAKKAKASARKVAKIMKKFPGSRETEDARAAASRAAAEAGKAAEAAKAAAAAAKAIDAGAAEDAARDAADSQRTAEEEAARAAQMVGDAKQTLSAERERLEADARAARDRLSEDRERWAADAAAAVGAAIAVAAEVRGVAKEAKSAARKAKKEKREAKSGAKAAARASKSAAGLLKQLKALPKKAKKAGVGAGEPIVEKARALQAKIDGALSAAREGLAKVEGALKADVKPPPKEDPVLAALVAPEKKIKKTTRVKKPAGDGADSGVCDLDTVKSAVDGGNELGKGTLQACDKLSKRGSEYPDVNLQLARYFFKRKRWKAQRKALERATSYGQFKYDPVVLLNLIKVSIKTGKLNKALEYKDRLLQVKERLPPADRKRKVSEMYSLFAQTYEQKFYRDYEVDPDGEHLPLLEKAIDMWERYKSYAGGSDSKASKAIQGLKKMKEELLQ